jgi:hypothetical protein
MSCAHLRVHRERKRESAEKYREYRERETELNERERERENGQNGESSYLFLHLVIWQC